jgi:chemotaxis protein methyltransferase WspC
VVLREWRRVNATGTLQVLSVPCSSGEEPYSIAIALAEAAMPADRCRIDAVDVCGRSLARAREGLYGKNSFRGGNLGFRHAHFDVVDQGHQLHRDIRDQVRFHLGNLFTLDQVLGAHLYDVIFCRNLLIYFDEATQSRAMQLLRDRLAPDGVLFVAPSEAGLASAHGFAAAGVPRAFAFRKAPAGKAPRQPVRPAVASAVDRPRAKAAGVGVARRAPAGGQEALSALEQAMQLADAGRLGEAEEQCAAHLKRHGASVDVFHLLGLIHAAKGNVTSADGFYRKALYLDPCHSDTLLHLALLLEMQGDEEGARLLRARIARLDVKVAT